MRTGENRRADGSQYRQRRRRREAPLSSVGATTPIVIGTPTTTVGVLLFLLASNCPLVESFTSLSRQSRFDIHRSPSIVTNNVDYGDFLVMEQPNTETRWSSADGMRSSAPTPRRDATRKITGKHRATALKQGLQPVGRSMEVKNKSTNNQTTINGAHETAIQLPADHDPSPICRVVALSDRKLPTSQAELPQHLGQPPHMLRRLDDIYHAMARDETRRLKYIKDDGIYEREQEEELVSVTRKSLEDAGFTLLSRRDLDLCEALNAGYLLRLSIEPDVAELDPSIAQEFYPELYDEEGNPKEEMLFDGRVLVFRRGYSQEATKGRLLLPKVDYLQASLVQRSASWLKRRLNDIEEETAIRASRTYRRAASASLRGLRSLADRIENKRFASFVRNRIPEETPKLPNNSTSGNFIQLSRYGGSKLRSSDPVDSLSPFLICENTDRNYCEPCPMREMQKKAKISPEDSFYNCEGYGGDQLKCAYDVGTLGPDLKRPPMQILERVTIGSLVNVFSANSRRQLFKTIFSRSELVEPTYEEVVVVWRPLPNEKKKKRISTPKIVYELADMFDVEELSGALKKKKEPKPLPLEIRTFDQVPMANIAAVLPKTKLVFRPADAVVFDLVAFASFLLVIGSQRFDSPKLDFLAIASVSLWLLRTVLRYSNKLARYDLLVKTFLTSKISHRNAGAVKYIGTEAGSQRASRAALVHSWLTRKKHIGSRSRLCRDGSREVNELLQNGREIPFDMDSALNDLEDLGLVECNGENVEVVRDSKAVVSKLKRAWDVIFDGRMSLQDLAGRRGGPDALSP